MGSQNGLPTGEPLFGFSHPRSQLVHDFRRRGSLRRAGNYDWPAARLLGKYLSATQIKYTCIPHCGAIIPAFVEISTKLHQVEADSLMTQHAGK